METDRVTFIEIIPADQSPCRGKGIKMPGMIDIAKIIGGPPDDPDIRFFLPDSCLEWESKEDDEPQDAGNEFIRTASCLS